MWLVSHDCKHTIDLEDVQRFETFQAALRDDLWVIVARMRYEVPSMPHPGHTGAYINGIILWQGPVAALRVTLASFHQRMLKPEGELGLFYFGIQPSLIRGFKEKDDDDSDSDSSTRTR